MPDNSLQNAVAAALGSSRPDEVMEGIKAAVINELEILDPDVKIAKTDYFNHSYAPDLVLNWGKDEARDVYLRYNLRSAQAARDIELLGSRGPMLVSLDSKHDDDDAEISSAVSDEVERNPRSFVTNAPAIDRFGTAENATGNVAWAESVSAPLLHLFRRSIVQSGRGLLTSETADRLQRPEDSVNQERSELEYVKEFTSIVRDVLREDATARLQRASGLLAMALSGETGELDQLESAENSGDDQSIDVRASLIQGQLSKEEVRVLLPHLLRRSSNLDDRRFFRYLGGMMSLSQLEEMSSELEGVDLNKFVVANLNIWRADKVLLSFNADAIDSGSADAPTWSIHSRMLAASVGAWLAHFATDRRRGGSREDQRLAVWDDLMPALRSLNLSAIDLQGVSRRVQVSADDSSNILADAGSIRGNIDDEFRVRSVDVRPTVEDSSDVHADFASMTCLGRNAVLGDMAGCALTVLGHRYPISETERASLFGEPGAETERV